MHKKNEDNIKKSKERLILVAIKLAKQDERENNKYENKNGKKKQMCGDLKRQTNEILH